MLKYLNKWSDLYIGSRIGIYLSSSDEISNGDTRTRGWSLSTPDSKTSPMVVVTAAESDQKRRSTIDKFKPKLWRFNLSKPDQYKVYWDVDEVNKCLWLKFHGKRTLFRR